MLSGEKLSRRAQERAAHYGIYNIVNEMALWEAFGGREDYLNAPPWQVDRVRLVLIARAEHEREQAAEMKRQSESASSGTSGGMGARTTSSSYWSE